MKNYKATEVYLAIQQDINTQILELLDAMLKHRNKQENDSNDWGYIGDITMVKETLKELTNFINENK